MTMTIQVWTHTVTQHETGIRWTVRVTMEGHGTRKRITRMEQRREGQARWRTVTQVIQGWSTVPTMAIV